jgi:peptidoglycan/LPS O-acetylase OafA/YrhL
LTVLLPVTGNTERTAPENRAFYPALDGLRAIAFLMVFFWHYMALAWGWAGVNIFFVISGFLITGILFDTRDDPHRVRNFYLRRVLRIFPLYYGVLLIVLLLYPFAHWRWSWHWLVWPAFVGNFAAYVHPYLSDSTTQRLVDFQLVAAHTAVYSPLFLGHFWSLCVEEQFYLIWPWVVFAARDRRALLWICAASVPVCLAARILGSNLLPGWMLAHDVLAHATPFRVDDLLLGGLLALLLRGPLAAGLLRWSRIAAPIAFFALLVWFFLTSAHHIGARPYLYPRSVLTWDFTAISVLTGLVIFAAIQPGTVLFRTLSLHPLRWLGRISYGAYVFHDIPHVLYARITHHFARASVPQAGLFGRLVWANIDLETSFLALLATCLIAWLSFRFYEARFLELKERWTVR